VAEAAVAPVADTPEAEVAPAVAAEVAEAADAKQKNCPFLGQFFLLDRLFQSLKDRFAKRPFH
jgi:hypothetical protein